VRPPRYLELDLPERFELQVQEAYGNFETFVVAGADDFERQTDGSYVCSNGGTLIFLRAVEVHDDHFVHVDGDGQGRGFSYRLVPFGRQRF
jgi:hypothetical protein